MPAVWERRLLSISACLLAAGLAPSVRATDPTAEQAEFFEKRIRPVLVKNCHACHSRALAKPMGGLRVDTREGLQHAVPRLLSVLAHSGLVKMPPSGKLPDDQIRDFEAWVRMGAPDPRTDMPAQPKGRVDFAEARKFWAFRTVEDPPVPEVRQNAWVRKPVDAFLLAKLEAAGLQPAPPADKRTLLRRVTYDLTGLPPTPAEVEAFVRDHAPEAYPRVVERLLASPRYGERWARHWLDLVRYAETNGHEFDNEKMAPWRYRDYVIRAFNEDVPYDQFVREHVAGDLLPVPRRRADDAVWESPLGTAFFWFGEVLNSATDPVKTRADEVDNQIDVMGKAFLGLTVACARCHDHKFDPIPTADYYALAGVLHSTDMREAVVDTPGRTQKIAELSREIRGINERIKRMTNAPEPRKATFRYRDSDEVFDSFGSSSFGEWTPSGAAFGEAPVRGAADSLAAGSDVFVGTLTSKKFHTGKKRYLHVRVSGTKSDAALNERGLLRFTLVNGGYKAQHVVPTGSGTPVWKTLTLTLERERLCWFEIVDHSRKGRIAIDEVVFSDEKEPPPVMQPDGPSGIAGTLSGDAARELQELGSRRTALEAQIPDSEFAMLAMDRDPHNVRIHIRGNHQSLGDEVPRRFLQVIAGEDQPPIESGSGRLRLAEWMLSPRNPLTARVMVNRIWAHHFAKGLVRTPDNFGATGDAPTHPELLDYLASRFVQSGWSVKAMHRLMLLSSAYQMASAAPVKDDPENKLLSHMPVLRLEAEEIRDAILAAAGSLNPAFGGPSVPPHISKYQDGRGKPKSGPLDGDGRRSIYIQVRRNFLTPMLLAFDYPLPISSIGARGSSTVPSQALLLMNNEFVALEARRWAKRAIADATDPQTRIRAMYEAAFSRPPDARETEEIIEFVALQSKLYSEASEENAWADVAHVLFNSPEFLYLR